MICPRHEPFLRFSRWSLLRSQWQLAVRFQRGPENDLCKRVTWAGRILDCSWVHLSSPHIYIYIYKCVRVSIVNVLRTYIFIHKYHTHIFCSSTLFILPTPTTDTLTYTDTRTRTHTRTYTHIYTYSLSISLSLFPSQLSQANKLCTWRFVDNRELWQRKTLLWIEKKREKV